MPGSSSDAIGVEDDWPKSVQTTLKNYRPVPGTEHKKTLSLFPSASVDAYASHEDVSY
jgi:hypothetical protein